MWIKICGMTAADAVDAALGARVDAIGFVFAPSVRRVDAALATRLAQPARGRARCVAVMLSPAQAEVDEILRDFAPDVLQADVPALAALALPSSLELLPVLRSGAVEPDALPARALFEGARSGTGETADWEVARRHASRCELVLAGGLNADNVAAAIRAVQPFGVDVSSGVELRPGIKCARRIGEFTDAARQAPREN